MEAPNWYVQQWQDGALHKYQSKGFTLKNVTTSPVRITGEKMHFMIAGVGEAEEDVSTGDDARPMNPGRSKITVDTKKSRAFDEVFEDDLDQMSVDEHQVTQDSSAMALGRVHDKTIVRALRDTTTTALGAYATAFGLELLLKGSQALQAADIPWEAGQIFCAVDSVAWNRLLTYKEFSSSDWVGPALPYVQGNLAKTWNGINVFQLSDAILREKDNALESTCLIWHKSAIGFGYTRQLTGNVVWDNRKDCWTHNMRMRIGSKLLLPEGAIKLRAKYDPADITIS